jgi:CubicO group peptidase (beta-lactamase class C family)
MKRGKMKTPNLMHGFPPEAETQVTLANWRSAPFNVWAFQHVREIVPSADIPNDPGQVRKLAARMEDICSLKVGRSSLAKVLDATCTDGIVVLHKGAVVFERYANGMSERTPHILMSVSKSMLGLLAGILIEQGVLDHDAPVTSIVPELERTAYAGATVRHLLDMRAGVQFDEDYLATSGPIVEYRKATNWNPLGPGEKASDLRSFYRHLKKPEGKHEGRFHYISPNTDLLGWVIERAAGCRYADLMSTHLWRPAGAADSAYITVDRLGAPRCAGGMNTTTRDLARIGQLLVDHGSRAGKQVVPLSWIDSMLRDGDNSAWNAGPFTDLYPGVPMHYRAKWYVERDKHPRMFGMGIHGQNLFVDPKNRLVIAKFSSQPQPLDARLIHLTSDLVLAIRQALC